MSQKPLIVYEDDLIIVVDKPTGIPSASIEGGKGETISAWLSARYPSQAGVGSDPREAGLVNRLDNDTSGLIVAARTDEAYEELRRQFSEGQVRKRYIALVIGAPQDRGVIDAPIAHHPRKASKMMACESEARSEEFRGRPAHTSFEVLQRFLMEGSPYALIAVMMKTGARHQIRVHLAHLGFPISGDRLYRNPKRREADPLNPPGHLLHSSKLTIVHPGTGEALTLVSPIPNDFKEQLARLGETQR